MVIWIPGNMHSMHAWWDPHKNWDGIFFCIYPAVTFLWLKKGVYSFNTISLCMYSHHLSNYSCLSLGISLAILSHYSSILCPSPSSLHLSESSISSSSTHMCHSVIYHWLFIASIMSWTSYIAILCTCKVLVFVVLSASHSHMVNHKLLLV